MPADDVERLRELVSGHGNNLAALTTDVSVSKSEILGLRARSQEHANYLSKHEMQIELMNSRLGTAELDIERVATAVNAVNMPSLRDQLTELCKQFSVLDKQNSIDKAVEKSENDSRKATMTKVWELAKPLIIAVLSAGGAALFAVKGCR